MAEVIIDQRQLSIVHFAAPLNGLGNVSFFRDAAVGRIIVGRADIAAGAEEFPHVLGDVEAVAVPCTVLLDSQWTCRHRFRRVPSDQPQHRVGASLQVAAGDLQVATVDVAMVKRYRAVHRHFLHVSSTHGIVAAFNHRRAFCLGLREDHRAIVGVILYRPNARGGLYRCLIAVGVISRHEGGLFSLRDARVLVELVGRIGEFVGQFLRRLAVADVVVAIAVGGSSQGGGDKFAAAVVGEGVVTGGFLPGRGSGNGAGERIVRVAPVDHGGCRALVGHGGDQVAFSLVGPGQRHVVGHGEAFRQTAVFLVPVTEAIFSPIIYSPSRSK